MSKAMILSTWDFGCSANIPAWSILKNGGSCIDAVEAAVKVAEADLTNHTVGIGGTPDALGIVTLDASIMKGSGTCGSVAYLASIAHPISIARIVMERTPHVMMVGDGALHLALNHGHISQDLLTTTSKQLFDTWRETTNSSLSPPLPIVNRENHDTIGVLVIDDKGSLAGGCSTSGLAFKLHGRVSDSCIIGGGLYVDDDVGAATGSGVGEEIIRIVGAHCIVELMRQGISPKAACCETITRIIRKNNIYNREIESDIKITTHTKKDIMMIQVGFIAVDKQGNIGAFSIHPGFTYACYSHIHPNVIFTSPSYFDENGNVNVYED